MMSDTIKSAAAIMTQKKHGEMLKQPTLAHCLNDAHAVPASIIPGKSATAQVGQARVLRFTTRLPHVTSMSRTPRIRHSRKTRINPQSPNIMAEETNIQTPQREAVDPASAGSALTWGREVKMRLGGRRNPEVVAARLLSRHGLRGLRCQPHETLQSAIMWWMRSNAIKWSVDNHPDGTTTLRWWPNDQTVPTKGGEERQ